jgi:hypothetical protein
MSKDPIVKHPVAVPFREFRVFRGEKIPVAKSIQFAKSVKFAVKNQW